MSIERVGLVSALALLVACLWVFVTRAGFDQT